MKRRNTSQRGWMLIVSVLVIVGLFILFLGSRMPEANARSRHVKVINATRAISMSMDTYFRTHSEFPAMRPMTEAAGDNASLLKLIDKAKGTELQTFKTKASNKTTFSDLVDPFSPARSLPYAYYTGNYRWVVSSPGPDGDYDINPKTAIESDWSTDTLVLIDLTYDPTNGSFSSGDVYRMGWPPY